MLNKFIGEKVKVKTALSSSVEDSLAPGSAVFTCGTLLEVDENFIKLEVVGKKERLFVF